MSCRSLICLLLCFLSACNATSKPHLLQFYGRECPHCKSMESVVSSVSKQLDVKVVRLEVWHNRENLALLQRLDRKTKCGGLPLFYNSRSGQWVCGGTTPYNLHLWASGQKCRTSCPPSLSEEEMASLTRKTGFFARLAGRLEEVRAKGHRKMKDRLDREMQKRHHPRPNA
eukprot:GHVS01095710.1.p1 GENE.GHVS01095710.1~~GHVS01095710.1.p1  ORF type:complete len:171 (+),score=14.10 GHVS01095710.1:46-558(+)